MKRPATRTMVMGHPLVATPIQLIGLGMMILFFRVGFDALIPGLIIAWAMGESIRASEEVQAYKRWKAEWDGLADPADLPPFRRVLHLGMGFGVLLAIFGVMAKTASGNGDLALGWTVIIGFLATAFFMLRWIARAFRSRRSRPAKAVPVTVVAKTIMPPVPLADAYAMLPEHCRRILTPPVS